MKWFIVLVSAAMMLATEIAWTADETTAPPAATTVEQTQNQPAEAQSQPAEAETVKVKAHLGPSIGILWPTSNKVQDTFGNNFTRYGIRPFITELPDKGRFMFDISFYSMDGDNDSATLLPLSAGFIKGISQSDNVLTYVAVCAGPYYANVDAPTLGVDKTGWGLNANATLGVELNQRWSLEARYDWMSKFSDLDFSAFSVLVAFKLFDVSL